MDRKQHKTFKKKLSRENLKAALARKEFKNRQALAFRFVSSLHHSFPDLFSKLQEITEFRARKQYEIAELVFAAIAMHLFKSGSRNSFNNIRKEKEFSINYFRAFGMSLPHMDSVDIVMRKIPNHELENLKTHLVKGLITKKIFYKYRIFGKFFNVSIDGTGIMTISEANIDNYQNALFRTYNKGKKDEFKIYFINVLEAKLVCPNGFCVSLQTEWIENSDTSEEYEKQDCELKAFTRLAGKLKSEFPRLPICIVGDGLYPNKNIFNICRDNNWAWIFTFKEGNLTSIWDELNSREINNDVKSLQDTAQIPFKDEEGKISTKEIILSYYWLRNLDYKEHRCHWVSLVETRDKEIIHKFVFLTSFVSTNKTVREIIKNGRLRFKIENEGFNTQKNLGYSLKHKYSESNELATKNYYTCIQIAHMINQVFELSTVVIAFTKSRNTLAALWEFIRSVFALVELGDDELQNATNRRLLVQFE